MSRLEEEFEKQDRQFFVDILFKIRDYAWDNQMDADDTIRTMANNMLKILEVATFNKRGGQKDD